MTLTQSYPFFTHPHHHHLLNLTTDMYFDEQEGEAAEVRAGLEFSSYIHPDAQPQSESAMLGFWPHVDPLDMSWKYDPPEFFYFTQSPLTGQPSW
jgi:hypothetical protein